VNFNNASNSMSKWADRPIIGIITILVSEV